MSRELGEVGLKYNSPLKLGLLYLRPTSPSTPSVGLNIHIIRAAHSKFQPVSEDFILRPTVEGGVLGGVGLKFNDPS